MAGAFPGRLQRIRAALATRRGGKSASSPINWASGDMAESVHNGPWIAQDGSAMAEPQAGHVAIVQAVRLSRGIDGVYRPYLTFARWPNRQYDARGFRKLTPRADAAIAADAAFLRRLKRNQTPAPSLHQWLAARLQRILS